MDKAPTDDLDTLLDSGVAILEWARRTERDCRERIADELLDLYNEDWLPVDATAHMTRTEFVRRLVPSSLVRDVNGSGYFYWADDGMFAGHWIELRFDQNYKVSEITLAG